MSLSSKWECLVTVPADDRERLLRIMAWLSKHNHRCRTHAEDWPVEQIEVLVLGRDMGRIRRELAEERGQGPTPG